MYQIAYFSSATHLMSSEELHRLLDESRVHNAASDITGMLLYKEGNFLQILEGEELVVRQLFQKIQRDPRHKGVIVVVDEAIPGREFPDWQMAYRDLSLETRPEVAGFSYFMNHPVKEPEARDALPSKCRRLLALFTKSVR